MKNSHFEHLVFTTVGGGGMAHFAPWPLDRPLEFWPRKPEP